MARWLVSPVLGDAYVRDYLYHYHRSEFMKDIRKASAPGAPGHGSVMLMFGIFSSFCSNLGDMPIFGRA